MSTDFDIGWEKLEKADRWGSFINGNAIGLIWSATSLITNKPMFTTSDLIGTIISLPLYLAKYIIKEDTIVLAVMTIIVGIILGKFVERIWRKNIMRKIYESDWF
jgi:hypothetical protein